MVSPAVHSGRQEDPAARLPELFAAAVRAVHPGPATAATLAAIPLPTAGGIHLIALGKGAHAMAESAVAALRERGAEPAGGVIVAHTDLAAQHPALAVAVGDHPLPGPRSHAAADAIGAAADTVGPDDLALVLLSGGASSLVGAPVDGVSPAELAELTDLLLGVGEDIGLVNLVRRRVARWGAGRLAVALRAARVECLVLSDVPGYDPALVGSGPCAPDPVPASEVVERLRRIGAWHRVPAGVRVRLEGAQHGRPDVPPADDPAFERVRVTLLADNATACRAAAEAAQRAGFDVERHEARLSGEARTLGAAIGARLREETAAPPLGAGLGTVHVWGGEPAVTLADAPSDARGGRMQELALAAARAIRGSRGVTLLAAGTDGRDGPTDAAGALVDGDTWDRIRAAGRDPDADLAAHRSHAALDAAGALVRTGPTGTNVADLVIAIVGAPAPSAASEPPSS